MATNRQNHRPPTGRTQCPLATGRISNCLVIRGGGARSSALHRFRFVVSALVRAHRAPAVIKLDSKNLGFIPIFAGPVPNVNYFHAGFVLVIMILPIITALTREIINAEQEPAYGLGSTRWEMIRQVVLFLVTMAVNMVARVIVWKFGFRAT